ncbi:hypothetical protein E2562_023135, partial [Oryza meyeriana var. granulata]
IYVSSMTLSMASVMRSWSRIPRPFSSMRRRNLEEIPWVVTGAGYVVESTVFFTDKDKEAADLLKRFC